jgi:hypothetical protein
MLMKPSVSVTTAQWMECLTIPGLEQRTAQLETALRELHPEVIAVFVKPQSRPQFKNCENGLVGVR